MANYTIQDFWRRRLSGFVTVPTVQLVRGWESCSQGLDTFKEAPLTLSVELSSDSDPENSPILLVSAPGAVGKSTLAQQIAFTTSAVYVDLAKADPVGGNAMSGGLVRSGLYEHWTAQTTAILIDGLDEARLRVTQEAFEAFLADVAALSKRREVPTVIFGRTGAIQDAWLLLSDSAVETAVLEIGYYDHLAAVEFALARVRAERPSSAHSAIERQAVELLLVKIRAQTETDGDRFAGYAPVLQAVATRVAKEQNPAGLVAEIQKGAQAITLQSVVSYVLNRERTKLENLPFEDLDLEAKLYLPEEQLDRLVARIYQVKPPDPPPMKPGDAHIYSSALETWVAEHPFLGGRSEPSSTVFDAAISVRALKNRVSAEVAAQRELRKGKAANPFLSEFYLPENQTTDRFRLPPEHVGIVYASIRARLSLGDSASLLIEGPEDAQEEESLKAEVEITVSRRDTERPRVVRFDSEQTGVLRLGGYVEDVELTVPNAHVEVGPGTEAVFVGPVSIQSNRLTILADKIIAESPPGTNEAAVFLETTVFEGAQILSVPILRGSVSLSLSWPGSRAHPWTSFATEPTPIADPRVDEALRRFRKFVIVFRSHSKGSLKRYKDKIDDERMTKGTGKAVLKALIAKKILSLSGAMYMLDPTLLGSQSGATYADCMSRKFGPTTIEFISRALRDGA